jgi:hypothetical protein
MKHIIVAFVAAFAAVSAACPANAANTVSCTSFAMSPATLTYDAIRTSSATPVTLPVTVSFTCTASSVGAGKGLTVTLKSTTIAPVMKNGTAFSLNYTVRDSQSNVLGDGTNGTAIFTFPPGDISTSGTPFSTSGLFVSIPGGQSAHIGTYTDTAYSLTVSWI